MVQNHIRLMTSVCIVLHAHVQFNLFDEVETTLTPSDTAITNYLDTAFLQLKALGVDFLVMDWKN